MEVLLESSWIVFFVYAFTSFFVIVNPIGGLLTYVSLTGGMNEVEKRTTARRSVTIACVLALFFAISGDLILKLFNITADNLRVAGGILLLAVSFDMMQARTSRESISDAELKDASRRDDIAVFPVATPLLTGPGAITTVIVLMRTGKTIDLKAITVLAVLLTFGITYIVFRFANKIYKILGVTVSLVITRITGLLLGAIAVDFIATGAWNIYRAFAD